MRVDPEGHRDRVEMRKAQRCTGVDKPEDGTAKFWAFLSVEQAAAFYERVDTIARQAQSPTDPRTLDQIRADVVAALLLATPGKASAVKVELYVTVSAATLLGLSEQPGELAGYGPITADLARELAGDSTWRRLLTDPVTGEALEFGTSTYRPPAKLRRFVWTRDRICRFPGCMRPSHKSDLDHTVPFPLGSTSAANLGVFCRYHHRVKHRSAWKPPSPAQARSTSAAPQARPTSANPNQCSATRHPSDAPVADRDLDCILPAGKVPVGHGGHQRQEFFHRSNWSRIASASSRAQCSTIRPLRTRTMSMPRTS